MSNLISGYTGVQAAMLRMCFWLMSIGLVFAASKAQSEEYPVATDLDLLAIQPLHSGADWLFPYQVKTDFIPAPRENTAAGSGLSNTLRLRLVTKPKEEAAWPASAHWQISNGDRTSLSPVLRFETENDRFEIKPRHNSIWVEWRKGFN